MKASLVGGLFFLLLLIGGLVCGEAQAQITFNEATYQAMADSSAGETIAVGTQITLQNWQKYQKFMPLVMIAGYSQKYGFKIGSEPRYTIGVGPTQPIPMFNQYRLNTEKYSGQAKLTQVSTGGYTLENYGAGLPFPNPSGPLKPYQILYNVWTFYFPAMTYIDGASNGIDRYRNNFFQGVDVDMWRMCHQSDEGFPTCSPYGKGFLQSARYFLKYPEQVKYTTQVALLPDDPQKVQEIYVFLPSLRRSLRLSSAARCSPILGSDWAQDDNGDGMWFQPTNFKVKLLGEKKLLTMVHADKTHYYGGNLPGGERYWDRAGMPAWPSPEVGKWEMRDVYIIDTAPLPVMGSYCYSHKIIYADKETFAQLYFDNYDATGKLYKTEYIMYRPVPVNDHESYIVRAHSSEAMIDWQNTHATTWLHGIEPQLNKLCRHNVTLNPETNAFPSGLANIMK